MHTTGTDEEAAMEITAELGARSLPDHSGESVELASLWRDRPVVLVFLRHFG
jgi:hypothetical protein